MIQRRLMFIGSNKTDLYKGRYWREIRRVAWHWHRSGRKRIRSRVLTATLSPCRRTAINAIFRHSTDIWH